MQIISQLHKLEFLNLSENCLSQRIDDFGPFVEDHCKDAMSSIKKLVLNNTSVPLETVYSLLNYLTGYVCLTIVSCMPLRSASSSSSATTREILLCLVQSQSALWEVLGLSFS